MAGSNRYNRKGNEDAGNRNRGTSLGSSLRRAFSDDGDAFPEGDAGYGGYGSSRYGGSGYGGSGRSGSEQSADPEELRDSGRKNTRNNHRKEAPARKPRSKKWALGFGRSARGKAPVGNDPMPADYGYEDTGYDPGYEDSEYEDSGYKDSEYEDSEYEDRGYRDQGYRDQGYRDQGYRDRRYRDPEEDEPVEDEPEYDPDEEAAGSGDPEDRNPGISAGGSGKGSSSRAQLKASGAYIYGVYDEQDRVDFLDDPEEAEEPEQEPRLSRRERRREEKRLREEQKREKADNVIRVGGDRDLQEENLSRQKRRKQRHARIFVLFIALLIIAGVAYYVYTHIREFKGYKVLSSTDTVYEANAEYTEFGGNLLKITSEGVTYIDANGNVVWTAGADLHIPVVSTRGDWAVVADKGGNEVHLFNVEGAVNKLTMPYKVLDCDIAVQGAFVVMLESDTTNYVNMYDKNGSQIYEMQTSIDKSGYPLDISISDDGEKLFTSYFFMEGIETKNNLSAYNFGTVGQNANADRIVGGFSLDGELVTRVQFLTNNLVAAFGDSEIILYDMKETPSERCRIKYQQPQIQSIFYSDKYLGTIERTSDAADSTGYVMRLYDLSGNESFHYAFNMAYDRIHAADGEVIITGGNQCLVVTDKGRVKFRYAFDSAVRSMIPTSGSNEYIMTFEGKTEKIRLRMEDK